MKKKYLKIFAFCLMVVFIVIRISLEILIKDKGLYLLHDSIYRIINYSIIFLGLSLLPKNKIIRRVGYAIFGALFIVNTLGYIKDFKSPLFYSYSPNKEHVVIIKETDDPIKGSYGLTIAHKIFVRIDDKFFTDDEYRTFSKGTYKVRWIEEDIATVTYLSGNRNKLIQHIYNYRASTATSYSNVLGSINGKWVDKNNLNNTLDLTSENIKLDIDGETYFYYFGNADEQGISGTVLYGAEGVPSVSIILNDDNTILVGLVSLNSENFNTYVRED